MKRACLTFPIWILSVVFACRLFVPTVNCITDEEGESSPPKTTTIEDELILLADNFMGGKSSGVDELTSVIGSIIKKGGYDADSFQMIFEFTKSAIERMETVADERKLIIDVKLEEARAINDEVGITKLLEERKEIEMHETKMFHLLDDMKGISAWMSSTENNDVEEENVGGDEGEEEEEEEEEEFDPMGLQIWDGKKLSYVKE